MSSYVAVHAVVPVLCPDGVVRWAPAVVYCPVGKIYDFIPM